MDIVEIKVALQTKRGDEVEVNDLEGSERALKAVRERDGAVKPDVDAVVGMVVRRYFKVKETDSRADIERLQLYAVF